MEQLQVSLGVSFPQGLMLQPEPGLAVLHKRLADCWGLLREQSWGCVQVKAGPVGIGETLQRSREKIPGSSLGGGWGLEEVLELAGGGARRSSTQRSKRGSHKHRGEEGVHWARVRAEGLVQAQTQNPAGVSLRWRRRVRWGAGWGCGALLGWTSSAALHQKHWQRNEDIDRKPGQHGRSGAKHREKNNYLCVYDNEWNKESISPMYNTRNITLQTYLDRFFSAFPLAVIALLLVEINQYQHCLRVPSLLYNSYLCKQQHSSHCATAANLIL